MFKRGVDLLCAVAGLLLLSPLFVAVALSIRLDSPGPVFFRQERVGRGGRLSGSTSSGRWSSMRRPSGRV